MLDSCKIVQKQSEAFHTFLWHFFPSLKQNFIAYRSSKVSSRPNCIFKFTSCAIQALVECFPIPEIIKISQSSHKMYSNNILNFQESTTILNVCTKKVWTLIECSTYSLSCPLSINKFYKFFNCVHFIYYSRLTGRPLHVMMIHKGYRMGRFTQHLV